MTDWFKRSMAGGLLGAQVLLLAVVPSADARLEAEAVEPHFHSAAALAEPGSHPRSQHATSPDAPSQEAGATSPGIRAGASEVHASHPSHDHLLCDLCRALSVIGGPAPAPEGAISLAHRPMGPAAAGHQRPAPSTLFLPVGSRAPPA